MKQAKGVLQKVSTVSGIISFVLSAICAVFLYLKVEEIGFENPISASLLASIFFFLFVGFLLVFIGGCNIPSFKFDDSKEK